MIEKTSEQLALKTRVTVGLLIVAMVVRVPVFIFGHPLTAPDTQGYNALASRLSHFDQEPRLIWLVRLCFGLVISVTLFHICYAITRSTRWSLIAAIPYAVGPHFLVYESYLLTEPLCTLLLILSIYLYLRIVTRPATASWPVYSLLGAIVEFGILTRPMQIILLPLIAVALYIDPRPLFGGATLVALGFQTLLSSFFVSMLGIQRR